MPYRIPESPEDIHGLPDELDSKAPKASPVFSGPVGIGTDTPNSPLHIHVGGSATGWTPQVGNGFCLSNLLSSASNIFMSLIGGVAGFTGFYLGTNAAPTTAGVTHEAATNTLSLRVGSANRLNISTAGGFDINLWARVRQYFRLDSIADSAAANSSMFASSARGGRPCYKTSTGVVLDLTETCAIPGAYRARTGLQRWRQSTGDAWRIGGIGLDGIDIPIISDSTGEGFGALDYHHETWAHYLRVMLQDHFNPPGVIGGMGAVQLLTGMQPGASGWPGVTFDCWDFSEAGWTKTDHTDGVGARMARADVGDTAQARFDFDGTDPDAVYKRLGVTQLDILHTISTANAGTWRYDVHHADEFIPVGTAAIAGTAPDLTSTSIVDGVRYRIPSALDPADRNVIQITGPGSGTKYGYVSGVVAYNGDYDCGVRVHNLSNGATQASHYTSSRNLVSNIDAWGSMTGGATNAKLFIFGFITNEAAAGISPATFKTNYQTLISRALACPSEPSVLLIIPCLPGAGQPALANYASLVSVIYELAEANEHVCVLNLNEFIGGGDRSGIPTKRRWVHDALHYTSRAQRVWAWLIFKLLTSA